MQKMCGIFLLKFVRKLLKICGENFGKFTRFLGHFRGAGVRGNVRESEKVSAPRILPISCGGPEPVGAGLGRRLGPAVVAHGGLLASIEGPGRRLHPDGPPLGNNACPNFHACLYIPLSDL